MIAQRSIKGLFIYLLLGMIAMFTLYLYTVTALMADPMELEQIRDMTGIPMSAEMLALLFIIQPFVLLIIALVIGYFTAHKVGLKSVIVHPDAREKSKSDWMKGIRLAIILGLVAGVVIRGFDYLFQAFLPSTIIEALQPYEALEFLVALLYGGIVEELLMRFGMMSLLVFLLWKIFDRKSTKPANWIFILSILISALIFALGHYGATALATEMTPFIWFRMILLNGLGGLFFGWIYWKHNLELAMLAHMFAHISMNLIMWIVSFL